MMVIEYPDGLVIHLAPVTYHEPCDKTYSGYTAHWCPALVPKSAEAPAVELWRWIADGDQT